MGYFTSYKLSTFAALPEQEVAVENYFKDEDRYSSDAEDFIEKLLNEEDQDDVKWYDHEEDMTAFSKKLPGITFLLEGSGERQGDVWKKYFRDGKSLVCKAKLTFEPFDVTKLT